MAEPSRLTQAREHVEHMVAKWRRYPKSRPMMLGCRLPVSSLESAARALAIVEQLAQEPGESELVLDARALRNFCSQCGQTYDDPACGFAHATLQARRQLLARDLLEGR